MCGCDGVNLTQVDFLDVVEPLDDAKASFVCESSYFKHVESEEPIDCAIFEQNAQLATHYVTTLTEIGHDSDSYFRILKRTTVHLKAASVWKAQTGMGIISGEAWFERIDVGRDTTALAHESMHVYDLSHWRLDTCNHPGWNEFCPDAGPTKDRSCNYYRADYDYASWAQIPYP